MSPCISSYVETKVNVIRLTKAAVILFLSQVATKLNKNNPDFALHPDVFKHLIRASS